MDDSHVNQVTLSEVLNQKAYVLFYIRVPTDGVRQNLNKTTTLSPLMVRKAILLLFPFNFDIFLECSFETCM